MAGHCNGRGAEAWEGTLALLAGPDPALPGIEQPGFAGCYRGALPQRIRPEIVLVEGAHEAAGFFEDQRSGGIVPQFLSAMQVDVETPGGDIAPFQGACAEIALGRIRRLRHQLAREPGWEALEIDLGHGIAQ